MLDVLILVLEFAEVHEVISAAMIVFCYLGQLAPVPPTRNLVELIYIIKKSIYLHKYVNKEIVYCYSTLFSKVLMTSLVSFTSSDITG